MADSWLRHVDAYTAKDKDEDFYGAALNALAQSVNATGDPTVQKMVGGMGDYLTTEDNSVRARALLLIAEVMALPSAKTPPQDLHHLAEFFWSRLADWPSLKGAARGCLCLLNKPALAPADAAAIAAALLDELHVQSLSVSDRLLCLDLFKSILAVHPSAVAGIEDAFVQGVVAAVDGEKDPRCLVLAFEIMALLPAALHGQAAGEEALRKNHDEMFDVLTCYFPVSFTPPPGDKRHITRGDLAAPLARAMAATPLYAPACIALAIEKLGAAQESARVDALEVLALCAESFGPSVVQEYAAPVWAALRGALVAPDESGAPEAGASESAVARAAAACLSRAVRATWRAGGGGSDIQRLVLADEEPLIADLLASLASEGEGGTTAQMARAASRAAAAGRVLGAATGGTVEGCRAVISSVGARIVAAVTAAIDAGRGDAAEHVPCCGLVALEGCVHAARAAAEEDAAAAVATPPLAGLAEDILTLAQRTAELASSTAATNGAPALRLATEAARLLASFPLAAPALGRDQLRAAASLLLGVAAGPRAEAAASALAALAELGAAGGDDILVEAILSPGGGAVPVAALGALGGSRSAVRGRALPVLRGMLGGGDAGAAGRALLDHLLPACQPPLKEEEEEEVAGIVSDLLAGRGGVLGTLGTDVAVCLARECTALCGLARQGPLASSAVAALLPAGAERRVGAGPIAPVACAVLSALRGPAALPAAPGEADLVAALTAGALSAGEGGRGGGGRDGGSPLSAQGEAAAQAAAALVNKSGAEGSVAAALDLLLPAVAAAPAGGQGHAVAALVWVTQGLVMRAHPRAPEAVGALLGVLARAATAQGQGAGAVAAVTAAARGLGALAGAPTEDGAALLKRHHATARILYAQRYFTAALLPLLAALQPPQPEQEARAAPEAGGGAQYDWSRAAAHLALAHLLRDTPAAARQAELPRLLPMALDSLEALSAPGPLEDGAAVQSTLLVLAGVLMDPTQGAPLAAQHTPALVSRLVRLVGYAPRMAVRETALQCVTALAALERAAVYPHRAAVLAALSRALDDPKRRVRNEAARCKGVWESQFG